MFECFHKNCGKKAEIFSDIVAHEKSAHPCNGAVVCCGCAFHGPLTREHDKVTRLSENFRTHFIFITQYTSGFSSSTGQTQKTESIPNLNNNTNINKNNVNNNNNNSNINNSGNNKRRLSNSNEESERSKKPKHSIWDCDQYHSHSFEAKESNTL